MGVYIKGMIMPKSCDYCRFCLEEDVMFETEFKCDLTGKFINGDYEGNVPDDCPLVAIPEKHGSSAQPEQNAYEQGRIAGRVEMRTEILSALKNMVGSEVWYNV